MFPSRLLLALTAIGLVSPGPVAHATSGEHGPHEPDYLVHRWTVDDGLPLNHLNDLAIDVGGALWVASYAGLRRFDGLEFYEPAGLRDTPGLPQRIVRLAALPNGGLVALTEGRQVLRLGPGGRRLVDISAPVSGQAAPRLTRLGSGLVALGLGAPTAIDGDLPDPLAALRAASDSLAHGTLAINSLAAGPDGSLWAGTDNRGVVQMGPGGVTRTFLEDQADYARRVLLLEPSGAAWIGGHGLWRITQGRVIAIASITGTALRDVCELRQVGESLVARDRAGLWRITGTRAEPILSARAARCHEASPAGASPVGRSPIEDSPFYFVGRQIRRDDRTVHETEATITRLVTHPSGDVYIGTEGAGLIRLRKRHVHTLSAPATWQRQSVDGVLVQRDGTTWLASITEGLHRVGAERPIRLLANRDDQAQPPGVLGLVETPSGAVVVGTDRGLCQVNSDTCDGLPDAPPTGSRHVFPLLAHGTPGREQIWCGALGPWANGAPSLFVRQQSGGEVSWREVMDPRGEPIPDAEQATRSSTGAIWIGTRSREVLRFHGDRVEPLGTGHATPVPIRGMTAASDGAVWVGTDGAGLCHAAENATQLACLGRSAGLPDDTVHVVLPDAFGRLYLATNGGIVRINRASFEAVAAGRESDLLAVRLTERDGMANRECNGILPQSAQRAPDGRLVFATQTGAAWLVPKALPALSPGPVELNTLTLNGEGLNADDAVLTLPATAENLRITWTAPALDAADAVRFRYRLRGRSWSQPTTDRTLQLFELPPGAAVLEVQAGQDGRWNESLLTIPLNRRPQFVETAWFPFAAGTTVIALVLLVWWWRERRQRALRLKLESAIERRTSELVDACEALEQQADELRDKSARIEEMGALRQRFVADLSHELRTPLTLIAGPVSDLEGALGDALDPTNQERLGVVRRNVTRLQELGDQLLDVARLDAHRMPLRVRNRDLVAFVRDTVERFRLGFEARGLTLGHTLPDAPLMIYFDADLIDKALGNLLANALKFTESGGVVVAIEPDDGAETAVRVVVTDTGPGVPPSRREAIFERFTQGAPGDSRRHGGVGIGLPLARELVALHGGELGVTDAAGGGSRFWFTLPLGADHLTADDIDLSEPAAPPAPDPASLSGDPVPRGEHDSGREARDPAPEDEPTTERPHVLLVEDHAEMRAWLAHHLGEQFELTLAVNGRDALDKARSRRPDVVVSDVMMPEMDGLALANALRSDPALRHTPLLLVSAKATEDDRVAGLQLADDYITKPVRPRELVLRVRKQLARRRPPFEPLAAGPVPSLESAEPVAEAPHPSPSPGAPTNGGSETPTRAEPTLTGAEPTPTGAEPTPTGAEPTPNTVPSPADARNLARIDAVIDANLSDARFGVTALAKAVGLSRRQLQREIRRLVDRSPTEHLQTARMNRARELLTSGARDTVAEVAGDVGLSVAYFSRLYTTWHGHAPSDDLAPRRG